MASTDYSLLCARIDYQFDDPALLEEALTHRSASKASYERLEFLGDAVLNLVMGEYLFRQYPDLPEGRLTRLRANLVSEVGLVDVAGQLELGQFVRLGGGEARSGGRDRPSILADAMEAIFGAIFLESGFDACRATVLRVYESALKNLNTDNIKDSKSALQEWLQARKHGLPEYRVVETVGRPHEQIFKVACIVAAKNHEVIGEASSRRAAEQDAAAKMLHWLTEQGKT